VASPVMVSPTFSDKPSWIALMLTVMRAAISPAPV
jgi:hypothetical protein